MGGHSRPMSWNPVRNFKELFGKDAGDSSERQELQQELSAEARQAMVEAAALVAPQSFVVAQDHVQVGDEYCRTLFIVSYPPLAEDNWLWPLYRFREALDISMHITPLDTRYVTNKLKGRIAKDEAIIQKNAEAGSLPDFRLERRLQDNVALLEAIENDTTRPFQVSFLVTVRANSLTELNEITEALERRMTMASTRRADLRQKDGFLSSLPVLQNHLHDTMTVRNIHTHGLQTMFPFTSADIAHEVGVLLGVNLTTQSNVIVNRFWQPRITNPGMAILGTSGSGKSYLAKMEMLRWAMLGVPVVVVDPQQEYDRLCAGVGGQFVDISVDSGDKINPLDFSHAVHPERDALRQKIGFALELIQAMLRAGRHDAPALNATQRSELAFALTELYAAYGYRTDSRHSQLQADPSNMPLLSDLADLLERKLRARKDPMFQQEMTPVSLGLRPYVGDGPFAGLFDHATTIDLKSHFIVFNIQKLPDQMLPVGMHLVLEFLRTSMFTHEQQISGRNRLLYVDEAQRLMAFPETAAFLDETARTARKFGIGFTVMTQDVDVFLLNPDGSENKWGRGILNNCATTILLRQHKNALDIVRRTFKLTDAEMRFLATASAGEGLMFLDQERAWFSSLNMTSPLEHAMITTTTSEMAQLQQGGAGGNIPPERSLPRG